MDIISRAPGFNIVSRCYALPPVYPDPTAPPAYVEIYWRARNADEPAPAWKLADVIAPTGFIEVEYNPTIDRDVEVAPMPYSASGTPAFSSIDDAFATIGQTLTHQRETDAPVIGQMGVATTNMVSFGIAGFSLFARLREVTVSANADLSDPLFVDPLTSTDYEKHALPLFYDLSRTANILRNEDGRPLLSEASTPLLAEDTSAALPQDVYVGVRHSGGRVWTPMSNILHLRFAAGDETGGTSGNFNPVPRDGRNIDA